MWISLIKCIGREKVVYSQRERIIKVRRTLLETLSKTLSVIQLFGAMPDSEIYSRRKSNVNIFLHK